MEKKSVLLNNGETYAYLEAGAGDPVILVHGNMSSSVHYMPILGALAEKYHVFAVDLRGFGDSSYNARFDTLCELAHDLKQFAAAVGVTRSHFVGWSAGGGVVFELAANYPELVRSLFVIEGTTHRGFPIYQKDEKGMPIIGKAYASKDDMAKDPLQVAPLLAAIASGNAAGMGWVWDQTIYTVNKPTAEQSALFLAETMKQRCLVDLDWALAVINMGDIQSAYGAGDGSIAKITCPCALTTCGKDIVVPEAMVRDNAAAIGENAKVISYPDSGHSPLVDCPNVLAKDIIEFFEEQK